MKGDFSHEDTMERFARLVGPGQLALLQQKHVMVIGLGGVGSWAAESIARSFVGRMTVVDCDIVVASNINRQLVADETTKGQHKADVMLERIRRIHPGIDARARVLRICEENLGELLTETPVDYVVDAIDELEAKCALIHYCHGHKIPLVVATGAAGRFNPAAIRVTDLATTKIDRLGRAVRRRLRDTYNWGHGPFGIKAVCSRETHRDAILWGDEIRHKKNIPIGTASFVTATFGMMCASVVIRELLGVPVETGMDA